jgi:hypothetical protein
MGSALPRPLQMQNFRQRRAVWAVAGPSQGSAKFQASLPRNDPHNQEFAAISSLAFYPVLWWV